MYPKDYVGLNAYLVKAISSNRARIIEMRHTHAKQWTSKKEYEFYTRIGVKSHYWRDFLCKVLCFEEDLAGEGGSHWLCQYPHHYKKNRKISFEEFNSRD